MTEQPSAGLLNRALGRVRRAWRGLARADRDALIGTLHPDLPPEDAERMRAQVKACLEARGGEVSARARAADLGRAYLELNGAGRERFFRLLAEDFRVDAEKLEAAIDALHTATAEEHFARERGLRAALEPPAVRLFTQFNALPEGVKFLVDLRADLLELAGNDNALRALDEDLKGLLTSWFDVGFLELRRITWDESASLLEKLIAYEAVHEIRSWEDLKNRLDSDRRLYGFFRPGMPDEPLIFVEVALVTGIAGNIQELLDEDAPAQDPDSADTAIFYSISNAQPGLRGVSFGSFLIKRVADALAHDLTGLKTFATLSPVPGFQAWLDERVAAGDEELLSAAEAEALGAFAEAATGPDALALVLARDDWARGDAAAVLRGALSRLCARYLLRDMVEGRARDPVAHFHLTNGASIERINWLADLSEKGLRQSAGMMVNYRYELSDIEAHHEAYRGEGEISASPEVRNLLKG